MIVEYDAAPDDAEWVMPHPVFQLAQDRDILAERVRELEKQLSPTHDERREEFGIPVEQEPKYTINGTHIINRATGEPIPHDEPIFIIRAKDDVAVEALGDYCSYLRANTPHNLAVHKRIDQFMEFAAQFPERMKHPDTAPQSPASGEQK